MPNAHTRTECPKLCARSVQKVLPTYGDSRAEALGGRSRHMRVK